jgi:zinc/manganese transport system permease protein
MNWAALELGILLPAFCAGLLVLATHVPLGQEVLRRGIIFIDLAVAQIAGLGVIAAHSFGWEEHGWAVQLAAAAAALAGAALLTFTEKRWPDIQEALIGTLFVLAATGGMILLAHDAHGGEQLKELLAGQILWVNWHDLGLAAAVYVPLLILWLGWREKLRRAGFYLVFALSVTVSVQLVGVYLVFASLIIPALATRRLWLAYAVGAAGYALGLVVSALWDLPSGAVIVWTLAGLALVAGRMR